MSDLELAAYTISRYMDLLRIKAAKDMDAVQAELDIQLCEVKAQLKALDVAAEKLVIQ